MVHGVADHVHNGVANAVYNGFVYLRVLADKRQLSTLIKLFTHITDNSVHLLEGIGHGNHPQGHGDILQFIRQLAELACVFGENIKVQPLQVGGSSHHGLCNDDLSNNGRQLIQLAEIDADQALLLMRGSDTCCGTWGGEWDRCFRRLRWGRTGLWRGEGSRHRRRMVIVRLVGAHRTRRAHNGNGLLPILCVFEHQEEAVLDHLFRGGGVIFHCRGFKKKIRLCTEVLDGHHQHVGPQILHAASLVKKDMQLIGKIGIATGFYEGGRFRR